ncbi:MAG: hypothetical protein AAFY28_10410 [Actinomycetota bacterium]
MGTPKRERQKANRAQAQMDQVQAENRQRYVRIGLIAAAAIIGVFALVWIASQIVGSDDNDNPSVVTTTPVTSPVTVTTPDSTTPVTVTTPSSPESTSDEESE